jgi:Tfp pilus assembly protein FimT
MFKVIFNHPKRVWGRFKINIFLLHTKAKPVIMNRITFLLALLLPVTLFSQKDNDKKENHSIGIGIRGGLNFANVTNASSINSSSQTGFHAGLFLSPTTKSVLGSRTELTFSRQGYNYKTSSNTGSVKLDYLILAQMMAINITKYVQLQIGGQTAVLLNAKADSVKQQSTGNATADKIMGFYNRIDYGLGGGIEFHPFKGILFGGRYTMSLANLYKSNTSSTGSMPSFIPGGNLNFRNNVVQVFAGYRF